MTEPRWLTDPGFNNFASGQLAAAGIQVRPGQNPGMVFLAALKVRSPAQCAAFIQRANAAFPPTPPRSERWEKEFAHEKVAKLWEKIPETSEIREWARDPEVDAIATMAGIRAAEGYTAGETMIALLNAASAVNASRADIAELSAATGGQFREDQLHSILGRMATIRDSEALTAHRDAREAETKRAADAERKERRKRLSTEERAVLDAREKKDEARRAKNKEEQDSSWRNAVKDSMEKAEAKARAEGWRPSKTLANRDELDREKLLRGAGGERADYELSPHLRSELAREQQETEAAEKAVDRHLGPPSETTNAE